MPDRQRDSQRAQGGFGRITIPARGLARPERLDRGRVDRGAGTQRARAGGEVM